MDPETASGGVFGRTGLASDWSQGDWIAMSGDLHVVEGYHGAYDPHSDIFFIGTQDNGTIEGLIPGD